MNVYDNYLRTDQAWSEGGSNKRKRGLRDTDWDSIIEGRVVLLRDFNTHSLKCNMNCSERRDPTGLERVVDAYNLILHNEPGKATRYTWRQTILITDWNFTTPTSEHWAHGSWKRSSQH